jgi:hypothetical protein
MMKVIINLDRNEVHEVKNVEEAKKLFVNYREENELMSSELHDGIIMNEKNIPTHTISYNGSVLEWDNEWNSYNNDTPIKKVWEKLRKTI